MRKVLAGMFCLSLLAVAANAAPIQFYFSTQGTVGGVPAEYAAGTTPTVETGETVYLWAASTYPDVWNGVGMQFGSNSPTFDVTSGVMYNPTQKGWGTRWEAGSDFDPVPDDLITLVGVTTKGLGAYGDPLQYEADLGGGVFVEHTLVGELDFSAFDGLSNIVEVYLEASGQGITLQGGTTQEEVYFGFGDGPIVNSADQGTRSALPDLYLHSDVPEPASLLLLGLAGFVLRRR